MRCEMLFDPTMHSHGKKMLKALADVAPIQVEKRNTYVGDCDLVFTYGPGHLGRRVWWKKQVAQGGHAIMFDLAYWKRKDDLDKPLRLTIDHDHPCALLGQTYASDRFDSLGIRLRDDYNPNGHIVIVGLGAKTNIMLGQKVTTWEKGALERVRAAYPKADVVYRPKREDGTTLPGTRLMSGGGIEDVLRGASLVVTRHSNVGVDACVAGVPVVTEDGAARHLYTGNLDNPSKPTPEQRLRFLRELAWWQWRPSEAKQCWEFLLGVLKVETGAVA